MHSRASLRAFRNGTLMLVLLTLALAATVAVGAVVLAAGDAELLWWFLGVAVSVPVLAVCYLVVGSRARCPLCMNPPLVPRRCQKHRNAGRVFGSYRYRVALSVLFLNRFTCPYCGESTELKMHRSRRG